MDGTWPESVSSGAVWWGLGQLKDQAGREPHGPMREGAASA